MIGSHLLLVCQILAHIGLLSMFFWASVEQWAICFLMYFLTGCFGMSMTFHRLLSHKSWLAPKWFKVLGCALGTVGLTGSAIAWPTIHRQHHIHPDQTNDPHSPNIQPWWRVQFFSMYYKPNLKLARDLIKDPTLVFFHRHYFQIQLLFAMMLLLVDPLAVIYAYLAPAALLWHGGSSINTIGHKWGYRNFAVRDKSVNNLLLGFIMWGEGWHNNHHARPSKKSFSQKPWEIDISYQFIRLLETKR